MTYDRKVFRGSQDAIGAPGDDAATDSTGDWTHVSLLKGIWAKLNGTLTVSVPVGGATSANQATEIASLASMDTKLSSINFSTDTLETALGIITETAPASDTASSGLNGRLQRVAQRLTSLIALVPASLGAKTAAASFSITTASDDNSIALMGAVNETAPASDTASSGQNGRLQRIAQRLTSLIAVVPVSLGAKTAAGSFSVTTASDDNSVALTGGVTETAPASDTASSGLNGRLQRIAQRITSLIALVPTSLGQKAMSASLAVTVASDQSTIAISPGASAATGGIASTSRIVSAANSTNATSAKASAGRLYFACGYNVAASVRFLKIYNKASAPTVGTDVPIMTLAIPPGAAFAFDFPHGFSFATGIAYAMTTGVLDGDATAVSTGDILGLNVGYV